MKKLAIAVLSFALILPTPAEAIFGSECRSLKKRTAANQIKYEQLWDKFQTTKAQFLASKPDYLNIISNNPIIPRYIQLNKHYATILEDFTKNKKCLTLENQRLPLEIYLKNVKKNIEKPDGYTVTKLDAFDDIPNFIDWIR
jgi:ribosomal protein S15P/S13E